MMIILKGMIKLGKFSISNKNDIPNPYKTDHDFRSINVDDAGEEDESIGFNLDVFDMRYQKNLEAAQPIKIECQFSENFPAGCRDIVML